MSIPASFIESLNGILIFEIGSKEFCVNNKYISEILNPYELSMNSKAIDHLVFEYSDMKLKIVDSENFLDDEMKKLSHSFRILIFDINNKIFGLLVDNVKEIVAADYNFIEKAMAFVPAEEDGYISAILKFEGRLIKYLDIEKISRDRVKIE
jgi:chemotaxis signal transduction protein